MKRLPARHTHAFHPLWPYLLIGVLAIVCYRLLPVLMPFAAAAILAYILHPAQHKLVTRGVNPNIAALLVMTSVLLLCLLLLVIVAPLLIDQFQILYAAVPKLAERASTHWLPALNARFGLQLGIDTQTLSTWVSSHSAELKSILPSLAQQLGSKGMALVNLLVNLALVPVVLFYALRDGNRLFPMLQSWVPRRLVGRVNRLFREFDDVLSEFLRGQLTVMLAMSVIYAGGLWAIGLEGALPVGIVSGMLTFIPYLGSFTGLLLATLAAASQYGSFAGLWPAWLVFGIGQTLEGNLITPKLVGDRIGLHPVAVIFALLAFGQLFGFVGVLLALPMAAVLQVGLRHLKRMYLASPTYRRAQRRAVR
ncbi:Predicted PurR-regulated permease PerM [Andreprevotia lacus DSM 23236]|jgi:predicted PurR-regulated permease PerM|uniref:Predicted PurR-regulated permease PerM n=1 Tax=Andreprevotia lacus DSM 23236 TaxID=1121001 RepID=A0A1W1XSP6_9NEIS|nr:AI-2E family transporter [Andreprevotia lacus]SMC26906.1 Predicted PurR-regulated permease PerM [Andreprevotia lacus DSM 23236]